MNGYSPRDMIREPVSVSAPSNEAVSEDMGLTAGGATRAVRVDFKVSGVSGSVDFKLQHRTIDDWSLTGGTGSTVSVSSDGEYSMFINIEGAPGAFPLKKQLRVIANGAGDATVEKMFLLQEL